MMDFGEGQPGEPESGGAREWEECFADYPLHLVCVNESLEAPDFARPCETSSPSCPAAGTKSG